MLQGWESFPWGAVVAFAGGFTTLSILALTEVFRRHFANKDGVYRDLNAMGEKVDRNVGLFVNIDDRLGALETKVDVLTERQTQEWKRLGDQMEATAETIRDVTRDLKELSRMQHDYAIRWERMNRQPDGG